MGSGSINTPQFFRCKTKYDIGQTRQSVIEKLSVKVYRKLAFLLQKSPTGNLHNRRNFDRTILRNGEGNYPVAGVQRAASPHSKGTGSAASLCRSRAAAIAQRSDACVTSYWVLPDAGTGRTGSKAAKCKEIPCHPACMKTGIFRWRENRKKGGKR